MSNMDADLQDIDTLNKTLENSLLGMKNINETLKDTSTEVKTLELNIGKLI